MQKRSRFFSKTLLFILIVLLATFVSASSSESQNNKALANKFSSFEEILGYRSFPEYNQAPELSELVNKGELPPVEKRLPLEPFYWKSAAMVDGVGVYGGVQRRYQGLATEGWNHAAGQSTGWGGGFGLKNDGLLRIGPIWMLEEPTPIPNLAKSMEWSDDGKTLTMHLIEGAKWSDGVPFTAEDIEFTYEENVLDPQVPSYVSSGHWTYGGKVTELEVVDDYTIKWHFGTANPVQALFNMGSHFRAPVPAHVYKYYHPKYNSNMTYDDYNNSTPGEDLPAVVMGAFVPVKYRPGQQLIYVRNPYYYQVDEEGNQLPYWDEIIFNKAEDWQARVRNIQAGTCDIAPVQDPRQVPQVLSAAKTDSHFKCQPGGFNMPYQLNFNLSLHAGVDNDRDLALRKLFRKKKFRQAISHLINREGITAGVFPGGVVKPFYGAYPSGSPYYNKDMAEKYPYNIEKAKELLQELGFEDTDGDGIRNWPEGTSIEGDELQVVITTEASESEHEATAEAMIGDFEKAGIDLRVNNLQAGIFVQKEQSMDFDIMFGRSYAATPFVTPGEVGPTGESTPTWHKAGPGGSRDLLPFEKEIKGLLEEAVSETDPTRRAEIFGKILKLYTKNVYTAGIFEMNYYNCFADRHKNYPSDFPAHLYEWYHNGAPVQFRFTPKDEQLKSQHQGAIPTLSTYKSQDWYNEATEWYEENVKKIHWVAE